MARMTARQKESRKASRNKAQKKRMRSLKLYTSAIGGSLLVIVLAGGGWWLVDSGWVEKTTEQARLGWHHTLADAGLELRHMYIQGRHKTDKEQVLAAVGMQVGDSLYSASLEEVKHRLEALGTVREASVERRLPDTLSITLKERMPVALWQHKGALRLIDREGVVLVGEKPADNPGLLVVVGAGAPEKTEELLALLDRQPELAAKVTSAVRAGERRWNLRFVGGVEVLLPEKDARAALDKLAEMQRTQGILGKSVAAIDLRLAERIFIRLAPGVTVDGLASAASET